MHRSLFDNLRVALHSRGTTGRVRNREDLPVLPNIQFSAKRVWTDMALRLYHQGSGLGAWPKRKYSSVRFVSTARFKRRSAPKINTKGKRTKVAGFFLNVSNALDFFASSLFFVMPTRVCGAGSSLHGRCVETSMAPPLLVFECTMNAPALQATIRLMHIRNIRVLAILVWSTFPTST